MQRHYSIAETLPHRGRMVLLDELLDYSGSHARCALTIRQESMFFEPGRGVPAWVATEYLAQTVAVFGGILRLHDPAFLAKMPKDLPLLFLAGDADPVGEQGKGVQRAIQSLKDAGVQNIECKLYPGARHELLVETNHQEVFEDIGSWLEKHLA